MGLPVKSTAAQEMRKGIDRDVRIRKPALEGRMRGASTSSLSKRVRGGETHTVVGWRATMMEVFWGDGKATPLGHVGALCIQESSFEEAGRTEKLWVL